MYRKTFSTNRKTSVCFLLPQAKVSHQQWGCGHPRGLLPEWDFPRSPWTCVFSIPYVTSLGILPMEYFSERGKEPVNGKTVF